MSPEIPTFDPTALAIVMGIVSIFLLVAMILWIILPFVVYGIRNRLDTLIEIQRAQLAATRQNTSSAPGRARAAPIEITTDKHPLG